MSNNPTQTALFAAGCFWGVEETFRNVPGVLETEVGYTGGHTENPTYEDVCMHTTGHAEAVKVAFDLSVVSYDELLQVFWRSHDPTQINRQGPDIGDQYRSAIFYYTDEQREKALQSKTALESAGKYEEAIATQIAPAETFYRAEEYHQQYFLKRGGGTCHV